MAERGEIGRGEVRPLTGAGIEINPLITCTALWMFAPSRGRELKSECRSWGRRCRVRPLAGAIRTQKIEALPPPPEWAEGSLCVIILSHLRNFSNRRGER